MAAEARFQGLLASSAMDSNHFIAFGHLGCGGFLGKIHFNLNQSYCILFYRDGE